MPGIDSQTVQIIIQDLALLVTIVGWIYTGAKQTALLRETRKYQRLDRDLAVYRSRMDKASELTRSMIEASDKWFKFAGLAKAFLDEDKASEFQAASQKSEVYQGAMESKLHLALILHDPQFRTLRDLLSPDISENLYAMLRSSSSKIVDFIDATYFMEPTDKNIVDKVKYVASQAQQIGESLTSVADKFADAFAVLDQKLSNEY
jgi:hypothetical protein